MIRSDASVPDRRDLAERPARLRRIAVLCFLLALAGGCNDLNDLTKQYGLEETKLILLIRYPQYLDTRIDLQKPPAGTGFFFREGLRDGLLAEITQAMRASRPDESAPAFAMVFFPEDEVAHKTVFLDQYLNLLPGFRYLGQDYGGPYCEGPRAFRKALLREIWKSRACQDYHVARLRKGGVMGVGTGEGKR
jgi:hypothetical protein